MQTYGYTTALPVTSFNTSADTVAWTGYTAGDKCSAILCVNGTCDVSLQKCV